MLATDLVNIDGPQDETTDCRNWPLILFMRGS